MKSANGINLTMLCDFYELTMGNGYLDAGMADQICYFDLFFRDVPDGGGFAMPSPRGSSRSSTISKTFIFHRRISTICARAAFSARLFSTI